MEETWHSTERTDGQWIKRTTVYLEDIGHSTGG